MTNVDGDRGDSDQAAVTHDIEQILDHELEEILHRRREALRHCSSGSDARENLIGLALSGGGIRSGAVALGVLQAFHARHILPFIDYISTVSGGGYAGAYLSSAALKAGRTPQYVHADAKAGEDRSASNESDDTSEPALGSHHSIADEELFPIARTATGQPKQKMLRFIHGGTYLQKTWVFFNRYLIGLILIWTFVISGLVASTSLAAWAFRSLDHTSSRAWISALGFDSEIKLAFFPSFVLLIFWLILWSISYFKFGPRGTGIAARSVFLLLVFATLVAIAALLGNGEYDFPGMTQDSLTQEKTNARTIYTIIFAAILASLLPYLNPARLVQSGTSPKNTAERYTFWVATRALVFGVPFIFVAYFARENISGWNERRDDRITRAELNYDNYLSSPLWSQVARKAASTSESPERFGNIWEIKEDNSGLAFLVDRFNLLNDEELKHDLALTDRDQMDEMLQLRSDLRSRSGEFTLIKPTVGPVRQGQDSGDPDTFANESDDLNAHLVESAPPEDTNLTFPARWWHLIKYFGESVAGDSDNLHENPVYRLANEYVLEREIKWEIARSLNARLEDPELFSLMLPYASFSKAISEPKSVVGSELEAAFLAVKPHHKDVKFEQWRDRLKERRQQAKIQLVQVSRQHGGSSDPRVRRLVTGTPVSGEESTTNSPGFNTITNEEVKVAGAITEEERDRLIIAANRKLLEAYYGDLIDPKSIVWSSVVLAADQEKRMEWFWTALCLFVISGLFVDLNATSWHGFYSTQIGKAWIEDVPGMGQRIPLTRMETADVGRPYHLVNASLHVMGKTKDMATPRRADFLFSRLYCGSDRLGYARTAEYMNGGYTLDDAIAVSGAAVSPVQTSNLLVTALLTLFNVRLGQWVANPARPPFATKWVQFLRENWPITPFRVLISMFSDAEQRPTCFVADGGHYENLGVEPLLARRCKLIIAMDAGYDEEQQFSDLTKLIRIARVSHGISFKRVDREGEPIDLGPLMPSKPAEDSREDSDADEIDIRAEISKAISATKDSPESEQLKWSERHFLVLKIRYPKTESRQASEGYLIYMKSTLTGDEPLELRQFKKYEPEFPHNPTSDQFYDPVRFDAYVELGYHIANQIGPQKETSVPSQVCPKDFVNWITGDAEPTPGKQTPKKKKG